MSFPMQTKQQRTVGGRKTGSQVGGKKYPREERWMSETRPQHDKEERKQTACQQLRGNKVDDTSPILKQAGAATILRSKNT